MSADPREQAQEQGNARARQDTPQNERSEVASRDGNAAETGAGGQPFFVAPASYLKPLGRPQGPGAKAGAPGHGDNGGVGVKGGGAEKRMSIVEKDQIDGLVSYTRVPFSI